MGSKIYVGGLPFATTEAELEALFAEHGTVQSARVITDKYTGQSRGFAFVEMSTPEEAQTAINALNGTELGGRTKGYTLRTVCHPLSSPGRYHRC